MTLISQSQETFINKQHLKSSQSKSINKVHFRSDGFHWGPEPSGPAVSQLGVSMLMRHHKVQIQNLPSDPVLRTVLVQSDVHHHLLGEVQPTHNLQRNRKWGQRTVGSAEAVGSGTVPLTAQNSGRFYRRRPAAPGKALHPYPRCWPGRRLDPDTSRAGQTESDRTGAEKVLDSQWSFCCWFPLTLNWDAALMKPEEDSGVKSGSNWGHAPDDQ